MQSRGPDSPLQSARATASRRPGWQSGAADWIGLGRSVYGVIDEQLIKHAISSIRHRLGSGDSNLLVPFVASRPNSQLLSAHLVPILDQDHELRGYILTFEDITRQFGAESRGLLLRSLTEGHSSAIGGIRAAIETVLTFPEMDESGRQQFFEVIRDEALKMSQHLDQLEAEYGPELKRQLPVEEISEAICWARLNAHSRIRVGATSRSARPWSRCG